MRFLNLVGQRFGSLTVLSKTPERYKTYVVYECKCDCGNVLKASVYDLKYCKLKSCKDPECPHRHTETRRTNSRVDLTGKRFGNLVCIEKTGRSRHGSSIWVVRCDCGNTDEVQASWLMHHGTTMCSQCRFDKKHMTKTDKSKCSGGRPRKNRESKTRSRFHEWLAQQGIVLGQTFVKIEEKGE